MPAEQWVVLFLFLFSEATSDQYSRKTIWPQAVPLHYFSIYSRSDWLINSNTAIVYTVTKWHSWIQPDLFHKTGVTYKLHGCIPLTLRWHPFGKLLWGWCLLVLLVFNKCPWDDMYVIEMTASYELNNNQLFMLLLYEL